MAHGWSCLILNVRQGDQEVCCHTASPPLLYLLFFHNIVLDVSDAVDVDTIDHEQSDMHQDAEEITDINSDTDSDNSSGMVGSCL